MKFIQLNKNIRTALGITAMLSMACVVNADQQFLDDVIIDGSLCAGQDCVNGESFGFDTIRLKENNLRIKFQDTSNSASFPTRDWQLTANDSSNGGANKFSIDDIDGGRTPFTIEAGAPSHSLFVDDGGRVGFGTSTPVVELQVVDGDTPTLRLEQDGSSGFTPQTWDVAGNETNFFIRDVTTGSNLPFRIRAGAPGNSIFVDTDGDVGLGTASPVGQFHQYESNSSLGVTARFETLSTTKNVNISMKTGEQDWLLYNQTSATDNPLVIRDHTAGSDIVKIYPDGEVSVNGSLSLTEEVPPASKVGVAKLFLDSSDGDLKVIFPNGVIKTIATN